MGLVNDLVTEVERHREGSVPLDSPSTNGFPENFRERSGRFVLRQPYLLVALGLFTLSTLAGLSIGPLVHAFDSGPLTTSESTPSPVSARRPSLPSHDASTPASPAEQRPNPARFETIPTPPYESIIERTPTVTQVSVERTAAHTKVRFQIDGPATYHTQSLDGARRLDVSITAPSVDSATKGLDLSGTPIRTIRTISLAGETTFRLEFDEPETVHSFWTEDAMGSALELEIDDSGKGWARIERGDPAPTKADPRWEDLPAVEGPAQKALKRQQPPSPDMLSSLIPETIPQLPRSKRQTSSRFDISPSGQGPTLGRSRWVTDPDGNDPEFKISRSRSDQRRLDEREGERRAKQQVRAARLARAEGRQNEAITLYENALTVVPDHRTALMELTSLYVAESRTFDAIGLVRDARHRDPGDADLTMLHAQLIERTGDITTAIQILERSAQTITEAPEVHALAAAYLHQAGEFELAIDRYESILRRYPSQSRWWMGLGISFEAAGRSREALNVYRISSQLGELPTKSRRWVNSRIESLGREEG